MGRMARRSSAFENRGCGIDGVRYAEAIAEAVAEASGVRLESLLSPTRGPARVAAARQVAMYLAHVAGGLSLTEVGRAFRRDRTTVAHACAVVEDGRDEKGFDRWIDQLETQARGAPALGNAA
jgi:chromosomal replication initiation ATPase DnaA